MDPHELAIAALNEVVGVASHRRNSREVGKVTLNRSKSPRNGTGVDMMTNNKIVANPAKLLDSSQSFLGSDEEMSESEQPARDQNNAASGHRSSHSTIDGHDVGSTPATSTSDGFSSQSTNPDGQLSQLSQLSQIAAAQQPMSDEPATRLTIATALAAGQKRTADGEIKSASTSSPTNSHTRGHSRNTSSVSNVSTGSSRIGEV